MVTANRTAGQECLRRNQCVSFDMKINGQAKKVGLVRHTQCA